MDQPSDEKKKPQEEQPPAPHKEEPKERPFKIGLREVIAAVIAGVILLGIGGFVVHNISSGNGPGEEDPPPLAHAPTICTIRGIPDSGYLNATLTGTTKRVVAVAVWIVDDHHWYFKPVRHEGVSWSAPPDPTHLWEVGQPGDPPHTTFTFAMLARSKGAYHRLPDEEEGRRTIPDGFQTVGESVTVTKQELLGDGFTRRC